MGVMGQQRKQGYSKWQTRHGILLTVFLLIQAVVSVLTLVPITQTFLNLQAFVGDPNITTLDVRGNQAILLVGVLVTLVQLMSIVGIWRWERRAYHLMLLVYSVNIALGVLVGAAFWSIGSVIALVLFYALMSSKTGLLA